MIKLSPEGRRKACSAGIALVLGGTGLTLSTQEHNREAIAVSTNQSVHFIKSLGNAVDMTVGSKRPSANTAVTYPILSGGSISVFPPEGSNKVVLQEHSADGSVSLVSLGIQDGSVEEELDTCTPTECGSIAMSSRDGVIVFIDGHNVATKDSIATQDVSLGLASIAMTYYLTWADAQKGNQAVMPNYVSEFNNLAAFVPGAPVLTPTKR
jgi:hypothetical protein